jgi:gliding motility-associated-like protein
MLRSLFLFVSFIVGYQQVLSQCCLTYNDSLNNVGIINTFYPTLPNTILSAGSTSISLQAVPSIDVFGNSYGSTPILPGDVVLIIQIQGAVFNSSNSQLYGGNSNNNGPDNLGATGYTNLGSVGTYEFVIAQNSVPLTGGVLQLSGACSTGGIQHTYINADANGQTGQARYQVVRIPRFTNLTLQQNMTTTAWNGTVGGILAFFVQDELNFNGYSILADGKGFRGGYQNVRPSGANVTAIATTDIMLSSGKGEGICGTPRFLWNGQDQVDNGASWIGYPGGNYGRGAPGNAGGGGNTHNAGGGGGGGCGSGGVAGNGIAGSGTAAWPNGGRPGIGINLSFDQIIFGGGGGGGDANNAQTGVKGGAGGGLVFIKAGQITGNGVISAKGTNGQVGVFGSAPDGAGGGGGGGTIVLFSDASQNNANIQLISSGGNGGNTLNDSNDPHGPGGGGGGGKIFHNVIGSNLSLVVNAGLAGQTNNGNGSSHGAQNGQIGLASTINALAFYQNLPPAINPKPDANFTYPDICLNEPVTFTNTSIVSSSGGNSISSFSWNFGDGGTSNLENPAHTYSNAGNYTVTLIIQTNLGCIDTISQNVVIHTPFFSNNSAQNCDNYTWSTNGQTYNQSGQYLATYNTIFGCDSIYELDLTVFPSYTIAQQQTICSGELYAVGNNSFGNPGNYTITLQSVNGCDSTILLDLIVTPLPPSPQLSSTYVKCPGDEVTISADSVINTLIDWSGPANFASSNFSNTFILTPNLLGVYSATITQNNCTSFPGNIVLTYDYGLTFESWQVPNIITPNNDSMNDFWDIPALAQTCEDFNMVILNRWGNPLIELNSANPIFYGKDAENNDLDEGVFFYKLIFSDQVKHGFFHVFR